MVNMGQTTVTIGLLGNRGWLTVPQEENVFYSQSRGFPAAVSPVSDTPAGWRVVLLPAPVQNSIGDEDLMWENLHSICADSAWNGGVAFSSNIASCLWDPRLHRPRKVSVSVCLSLIKSSLLVMKHWTVCVATLINHNQIVLMWQPVTFYFDR